MSERELLQVEVASHAARVEEIMRALREIEERHPDQVPVALGRQAAQLRIELQGRAAAVEVGSARLRNLPG